ncbi:MAG: hypothetical protein PF495_12825 [Spirochaetales bacterium]|jgi:hypothetical protein|nr:hypothetical protein [Spirochaetales bacterium]
MVDNTYISKTYRKQGGDEFVVADGGKITVESGGIFEVDGENISTELKALSDLDAELALLEGITASAADINLIDGSVAGTSVANKALALGASKNTDEIGLPVSGLKIGAAGAEVVVTPTAAELNKLAGSGSTVASGTQQTHVADPAAGATVDAEARTAINAILDALEAFGINAAA